MSLSPSTTVEFSVQNDLKIFSFIYYFIHLIQKILQRDSESIKSIFFFFNYRSINALTCITEYLQEEWTSSPPSGFTNAIPITRRKAKRNTKGRIEIS